MNILKTEICLDFFAFYLKIVTVEKRFLTDCEEEKLMSLSLIIGGL